VAPTSRLTAAEVDELRRAAAVGPLDTAVVRRSLEDQRDLQADRAELRRQLERLCQPWGELRAVLNQMS